MNITYRARYVCTHIIRITYQHTHTPYIAAYRKSAFMNSVVFHRERKISASVCARENLLKSISKVTIHTCGSGKAAHERVTGESSEGGRGNPVSS